MNRNKNFTYEQDWPFLLELVTSKTVTQFLPVLYLNRLAGNVYTSIRCYANSRSTKQCSIVNKRAAKQQKKSYYGINKVHILCKNSSIGINTTFNFGQCITNNKTNSSSDNS